MNIITWLVAGGLMGWAASHYLGTMQKEAIAFNVAVATVGAALGDWILGPMLGVAPGFSGFGVIVAAISASLLLVIVHIVQRSVAR